MSREAMQLALEALEDANDVARMEFSDEDYYSEAINALRQALETEPVFVDQEYLERRWGVSGATLERDRSLKQGCKYFKIGGAIRYRLSDIEAYENKCLVETKAK
jgi:hypothetical protein